MPENKFPLCSKRAGRKEGEYNRKVVWIPERFPKISKFGKGFQNLQKDFKYLQNYFKYLQNYFKYLQKGFQISPKGCQISPKGFQISPKGFQISPKKYFKYLQNRSLGALQACLITSFTPFGQCDFFFRFCLLFCLFLFINFIQIFCMSF